MKSDSGDPHTIESKTAREVLPPRREPWGELSNYGPFDLLKIIRRFKSFLICKFMYWISLNFDKKFHGNIGHISNYCFHLLTIHPNLSLYNTDELFDER